MESNCWKACGQIEFDKDAAVKQLQPYYPYAPGDKNNSRGPST